MRDLIEAEVRKVCDRGHSLGWVPWYRTDKRLLLGHCVCGSRDISARLYLVQVGPDGERGGSTQRLGVPASE